MVDLQSKLQQMLKLKYYNPVYQIAFNHWKEMYFIAEEPHLLYPEVKHKPPGFCSVVRLHKHFDRTPGGFSN